jgi:aromatic ring-opening dioxygenase catalytic subunit (LigB family)
VQAAILLRKSAKLAYDQLSQGSKTHHVELDTSTMDDDLSQWRGRIVVYDNGFQKIASYYELNHTSALNHGYAGVPQQLYQLQYDRKPNPQQLADFIKQLRHG